MYREEMFKMKESFILIVDETETLVNFLDAAIHP